jgi:hypothetical protein
VQKILSKYKGCLLLLLVDTAGFPSHRRLVGRRVKIRYLRNVPPFTVRNFALEQLPVQQTNKRKIFRAVVKSHAVVALVAVKGGVAVQNIALLSQIIQRLLPKLTADSATALRVPTNPFECDA